MGYTELSLDLQNLLWYNYESFAKLIIILVLLSVSIIYLFYVMKNYKDTNNYLVIFYRVMLYLVSNIILYTSPLMLIFYLAPSYTMDNLVMMLLTIYSTCFVLFNIYLIVKIILIIINVTRKNGYFDPVRFKKVLFEELGYKKFKLKESR